MIGTTVAFLGLSIAVAISEFYYARRQWKKYKDSREPFFAAVAGHLVSGSLYVLFWFALIIAPIFRPKVATSEFNLFMFVIVVGVLMIKAVTARSMDRAFGAASTGLERYVPHVAFALLGAMMAGMSWFVISAEPDPVPFTFTEDEYTPYDAQVCAGERISYPLGFDVFVPDGVSDVEVTFRTSWHPADETDETRIVGSEHEAVWLYPFARSLRYERVTRQLPETVTAGDWVFYGKATDSVSGGVSSYRVQVSVADCE